MTIEIVQAHIAKVNEMVHGAPASQSTQVHTNEQVEPQQDISSMGQAVAIFDDVNEQVRAIRRNPALTAIGQADEERRVKKESAVKLAKMVDAYGSMRDMELDEAEKVAQAIVSSPNVAPDPFAVAEFDRKFTQLKTEFGVFGSKSAANEIKTMMETTSDPYYAAKIVEAFGELGPSLREHFGLLELQTAYDTAKRTAETDSRARARRSLEEIASLRKQSPVNSMIGMGIDSALGSEYRHVVVDAASFLRTNG